MKVLLVNGSPHPKGNTARALGFMEERLHAAGIETFRFQLEGKPVRGCIECESCRKTNRCAFNDDQCNELIEDMLEADAIVIGTPVYFAGANGALCALLDRVFYAIANRDQLLAGKPACGVATCWRAGATSSLDRLNKYFTYAQMPIVSSRYWNVYMGEDDTYGADVIRTLADNLADMLKKQK